jgi:hypothetical protein
LPQLDGYLLTDREHWWTVQSTLIDSQWARRYTVRASTVIAMFDTDYNQEPVASEQRIAAILRPPVEVRPKPRTTATLRAVSYTKHSGRTHRRKTVHPPAKRKLT